MSPYVYHHHGVLLLLQAAPRNTRNAVSRFGTNWSKTRCRVSYQLAPEGTSVMGPKHGIAFLSQKVGREVQCVLEASLLYTLHSSPFRGALFYQRGYLWGGRRSPTFGTIVGGDTGRNWGRLPVLRAMALPTLGGGVGGAPPSPPRPVSHNGGAFWGSPFPPLSGTSGTIVGGDTVT